MWLVAFFAATLVSLLFAAQWILASAARGLPEDWSYVLAWVLPEWLLWAALAPVVFALARRFPLSRKTWPLHAGAAAVLAVGHAAAFALVAWPLPWTRMSQVPLLELVRSLVGKKVLTNFLVYAILSGAAHVFAGRLRAIRLERELARAQVAALRQKLHPHFLGNALHAIAELIHRDPLAAERMVTRLGDLLRAALEADATEEVPLRRELELAERYIDIERVRFQDRLTVEVDADADTLDAMVPYLVLQPLLENAIRHGIAARPGAGRVAVSARREGDDLVVAVVDDGPGLGGQLSREGIGLASARVRLDLVGGHLELLDRLGGGAEARVVVPFRSPS